MGPKYGPKLENQKVISGRLALVATDHSGKFASFQSLVVSFYLAFLDVWGQFLGFHELVSQSGFIEVYIWCTFGCVWRVLNMRRRLAQSDRPKKGPRGNPRPRGLLASQGRILRIEMNSGSNHTTKIRADGGP